MYPQLHRAAVHTATKSPSATDTTKSPSNFSSGNNSEIVAKSTDKIDADGYVPLNLLSSLDLTITKSPSNPSSSIEENGAPHTRDDFSTRVSLDTRNKLQTMGVKPDKLSADEQELLKEVMQYSKNLQKMDQEYSFSNVY